MRGGRIDMLVFQTFAVLILFLVLMQKLAVPIGADRIQLSLPAFYICLGFLAWRRRVKLNLERGALYLFFALLAVVSNAISEGDLFSKSLTLVLVLYAPYVLEIEVSTETYRRIFDFFSGLMIFAVGLELAELVIQLIAGANAWPSMDELTPQELLVPQFVYIQPIKIGSHLMKPNAFFFLEVSFLAQFLGLALIAEYLLFKRTWRLILFSVGIILSFSGTGLLLVLLCLPLLATRTTPRSLLIIAGVTLVTGIAAVQFGWYDIISHRLGEYQRVGSSSNQRFVAPVEMINEVMQNRNILFTGQGSGAMTRGLNYAWWPSAKVMVEYGFVTTVSFFTFLGFCTFGRAPNLRLAIAVMVFYNFLGGGFATPVYALAPLLFCGLMRIQDKAAPGAPPLPLRPPILDPSADGATQWSQTGDRLRGRRRGARLSLNRPSSRRPC